MHAHGVVQEAVRLARDGELGNSNAIRLLQMRHTPEELREILSRFDEELTPQARGKLALWALAPLPPGVENQRFEPIFDRYPLSGETYTTASGTVVLSQCQYYNGQMLQLYGECSNVDAVRSEMAGSGYQPLVSMHPDGRETALVQFWCHNLSDTSLRPYNAMFLIVAAVPEDVPASGATIHADPNGASSVLSVLDGSYDAAEGVYVNKAHFYYAALLDSTQVAIEFGRERMGTDKRWGTIRLSHRGQQLGFVITNGSGALVARIDVMLTEDPAAYLPAVAEAARTAGVSFPRHPPGTEYVYPGVARIGHRPVVHWKWHTDVLPILQPVVPNTITFDAGSREGAMVHEWGFEPRVMGFIPNVRGVVTGVPDPETSQRVRIRPR